MEEKSFNEQLEELYKILYGEQEGAEIFRKEQEEEAIVREASIKAEEIIAQLREIRIKYFPNNDIENYSEEDKKKYVELNEEFEQLAEEKLGRRKNKFIKDKRDMEFYTKGKIEPMTESDYFDSHDMKYMFRNTLEIAKVAIEAIGYNMKTRNWDQVEMCEEIYEIAEKNFKGHPWGKSYIEDLQKYRNPQLTKIADEELTQMLEEYEKYGSDLTLEELIQSSESMNVLTWYMTVNLDKINQVNQVIDMIEAKITELESENEMIQEEEEFNASTIDDSNREEKEENTESERSDLEEWQKVLEEHYNVTIGIIGEEIELTEEMKNAIRNGEDIELPQIDDEYINETNKEFFQLYKGLLKEFEEWQKEKQKDEAEIDEEQRGEI